MYFELTYLFIRNFYSVKGPELINMYVGQSEENVREGKIVDKNKSWEEYYLIHPYCL